ncbi:MAG: hypothetical protein E7163_03040 [Firmicutes bacterium]|nr:hypothetical protein [Bacillota bacterium]
MAKINITKSSGGTESLTLLNAFKADNSDYVIFDSERLGSMGLPIIYVSKYTDKLEKINDVNEWQSVKNYLKGIINGTNFEYIKLPESINADEVYYTPLTLPQASFDAIKSRYIVDNRSNSGEETLALNDVSSISENVNINSSVTPALSNVAPTTPIMPNNNVISNVEVTNNPVNLAPISAVLHETSIVNNTNPQHESVVDPIVVPENPINNLENKNIQAGFESDKETFLRACENMFDALVSKYQKKLEDVERREQELARKELEIETKLRNAQEHLANAEARETVANIAHDHAQKVMDISAFMPNNPNDNQAGVI